MYKIIKCLSLGTLCLLLFISFLSIGFVSSESKKNTVKNEICIVYDNSGSTFQDMTWCRYKYALEVFASFVDYENGSKLHIFPLCPITIEGNDSSEKLNYVSIEKYEDISKIKNMLTIQPAGTPFTPVINAYNFLKNYSDAKNKRLLILTDGVFSYSSSNSPFNLEKELEKLASSSNIKIHYIGNDQAVNVQSNETVGLYTKYINKHVETSFLIDSLNEICSQVFGQVIFSKSNSKTLNFQLNFPIDKLIVMANGNNSEIVSLTDNNGNIVLMQNDVGKLTYDTSAAKNYANAPIDRELYSHMAIYKNCDVGEYKLTCKNTDNISVFYQNSLEESGHVTSSNILPKNEDNTEITVNSEKSHSGIWAILKKIIITILLITITLIIFSQLFYFLGRRDQRNKISINKSQPNENSETSSFIKEEKSEGYAFISYSSKNQTSAFALRELLKKNNINTWIAPNDIPVGSRYAKVISKTLKGCSCLVLLLTDAAQNSIWVSKEVERAINYKKTIIPIQLEDIVLNDEFELYISTDQIIAIDKIDDTSFAMKKILNSIKTCVNQDIN